MSYPWADGERTMNRLLAALERERPLQIAGAINAYAALLAQDAGFQALYLSGSGVASASFGLPDLAMTTLSEVVAETQRITSVTELPLLVDVDTGFGDGLGIGRMVREMTRAGAAGVHLEDQVAGKRCGHRLGKALVSSAEMEDRIGAAVAARGSGDLLIMARTDALAVEGLERAVERARAYAAAGADAIFFEAARALSEYASVAAAVAVPVLANMTEFGVSPLFTLAELRDHDVAMVLYPLTAFRAMSHAAQRAYRVLRAEGTQRPLLDELQPRGELYRVLNYEAYEQQMDAVLERQRGVGRTEDPDEQE